MKFITIKNWGEIPENYTGHIKWRNGDQSWHEDRILHREDGPAVIYADGKQSWYLNGVMYSKEKYYKELYKRKIITKEELFIELL